MDEKLDAETFIKQLCGQETPPLDEITEWKLEEIYDLERVWS